MQLYEYVPPYRLIRTLALNVYCRLAPVSDIETLFQTILCAQGGHEACVPEMWDWAALNALVEDSLKTLIERHHKRFRVCFLMNDKLCGTDMERPTGRRCPRGVSCLSLKSSVFVLIEFQASHQNASD
jgi:hypothetical protein